MTMSENEPSPGAGYVRRGFDIVATMSIVVIPKLLGAGGVIRLWLTRLIEHGQDMGGIVNEIGVFFLVLIRSMYGALFPVIVLYFLIGIYLMYVGREIGQGTREPDDVAGVEMARGLVLLSLIYVAVVVVF